MTTRRMARLSVPVILALGLVACGGSDDESTETESPVNTESVNADAPSDTASEQSDGSQTVTNDPWQKTATEFGLEVGESASHVCPAGGAEYQLWGTGPFTDDSSVCTAAVFAGAITLADGGTVSFTIVEPLSSYEGGESNGIVADEYGNWPGAFVVDLD